MKARSTITVTLYDGPQSQVSTLVDYDISTAEDLWDELERIYRISNNKMEINIELEL